LAFSQRSSTAHWRDNPICRYVSGLIPSVAFWSRQHVGLSPLVFTGRSKQGCQSTHPAECGIAFGDQRPPPGQLRSLWGAQDLAVYGPCTLGGGPLPGRQLDALSTCQRCVCVAANPKSRSLRRHWVFGRIWSTGIFRSMRPRRWCVAGIIYMRN